MMNRTIRKRIKMQKKRAAELRLKQIDASCHAKFLEYMGKKKQHDAFNQELRQEGKFGVAYSIDALMANINQIAENPDKYLLSLKLEDVLENPAIAGIYNSNKEYEYADLPGEHEGQTNPETVTVMMSNSDGDLPMAIERATRNLAYKILKRKATHGVDYKCIIAGDSVAMSAVPIILTVE